MMFCSYLCRTNTLDLFFIKNIKHPWYHG